MDCYAAIAPDDMDSALESRETTEVQYQIDWLVLFPVKMIIFWHRQQHKIWLTNEEGCLCLKRWR